MTRSGFRFFNLKKQSLLSTQASYNVTVWHEKGAEIAQKTQKIDRWLSRNYKFLCETFRRLHSTQPVRRRIKQKKDNVFFKWLCIFIFIYLKRNRVVSAFCMCLRCLLEKFTNAYLQYLVPTLWVTCYVNVSCSHACFSRRELWWRNVCFGDSCLSKLIYIFTAYFFSVC